MKIVGHRGAKGLAPENTLASIQKALDCGVDAVEFDLRTTSDGKVVVLHDRAIKPTDGLPLDIATHTYAELLAAKPDLATFEEVIKLVNKRVLLWIEVKPEAQTEAIITIIKSYLANGWKPEHFLFASFSPLTLRTLRTAFPEIPVAVNESYSGVRATWRARKLGTKLIVMNQRWLWSGFIKSMARGGYQLGAYTLNDVAKAARWQGYGLATVVTDYPDRIKSQKN